MIIMLFDVPAEYGGALSILKQYYEKATNDKDNQWYFVISTPDLAETENVKIIKHAWVKKSWLHRLYFDKFVAHKLVEQYKVDEVISLQNVIVQGISVKQTLYLHQTLPFATKRYHITEDFKLWVYQNLISEMIFSSIRKASEVIVQTFWLKEACVKKAGVVPDKFKVIRPEVKIVVKKSYRQEDVNNTLFFYPAGGVVYKNHKVIVEAAKMLKYQGIENYRIIFTLQGNENGKIKKLYNEVKKLKLSIEFIGHISLEEVYEYYSKSILLFPSYIESFGLPMLEARIHCSPILASDYAFSHEILEGYDKVEFFDPFNKMQLTKLLIGSLNKEIE